MEHGQQDAEPIGAILSGIATLLRELGDQLDAAATRLDDETGLDTRLKKLESWAFRTGQDISNLQARMDKVETGTARPAGTARPTRAERREAAERAELAAADQGGPSRSAATGDSSTADVVPFTARPGLDATGSPGRQPFPRPAGGQEAADLSPDASDGVRPGRGAQAGRNGRASATASTASTELPTRAATNSGGAEAETSRTDTPRLTSSGAAASETDSTVSHADPAPESRLDTPRQPGRAGALPPQHGDGAAAEPVAGVNVHSAAPDGAASTGQRGGGATETHGSDSAGEQGTGSTGQHSAATAAPHATGSTGQHSAGTAESHATDSAAQHSAGTAAPHATDSAGQHSAAFTGQHGMGSPGARFTAEHGGDRASRHDGDAATQLGSQPTARHGIDPSSRHGRAAVEEQGADGARRDTDPAGTGPAVRQDPTVEVRQGADWTAQSGAVPSAQQGDTLAARQGIGAETQPGAGTTARDGDAAARPRIAPAADRGMDPARRRAESTGPGDVDSAGQSATWAGPGGSEQNELDAAGPAGGAGRTTDRSADPGPWTSADAASGIQPTGRRAADESADAHDTAAEGHARTEPPRGAVTEPAPGGRRAAGQRADAHGTAGVAHGHGEPSEGGHFAAEAELSAGGRRAADNTHAPDGEGRPQAAHPASGHPAAPTTLPSRVRRAAGQHIEAREEAAAAQTERPDGAAAELPASGRRAGESADGPGAAVPHAQVERPEGAAGARPLPRAARARQADSGTAWSASGGAGGAAENRPPTPEFGGAAPSGVTPRPDAALAPPPGGPDPHSDEVRRPGRFRAESAPQATAAAPDSGATGAESAAPSGEATGFPGPFAPSGAGTDAGSVPADTAHPDAPVRLPQRSRPARDTAAETTGPDVARGGLPQRGRAPEQPDAPLPHRDPLAAITGDTRSGSEDHPPGRPGSEPRRDPLPEIAADRGPRVESPAPSFPESRYADLERLAAETAYIDDEPTPPAGESPSGTATPRTGSEIATERVAAPMRTPQVPPALHDWMDPLPPNPAPHHGDPGESNGGVEPAGITPRPGRPEAANPFGPPTAALTPEPPATGRPPSGDIPFQVEPVVDDAVSPPRRPTIEENAHVDKLQAMLDELKRNPAGPFGRHTPPENPGH
ncbi:hypothetical protein [Nocardia farcinica]|uniref:hypothetical protein n=1 Tax=Nocardia farcinica TaxID=37329 RepID=UPI001894D43F|nr:hypothetical protein [Nocardia farcinica]MBF6266656.1 hypothetical protein [Nocardia farcinica]